MNKISIEIFSTNKIGFVFISIFIITSFINNYVNKSKLNDDKTLRIKEILCGKHDYVHDNTFTKIDSKYCFEETYLDNETYQAFIKMNTSAIKDSINLLITSGLRSFEQQNFLWDVEWYIYGNLNDKQKVIEILKFTSMPSTSRHHWGTEVDISLVDADSLNLKEESSVYKWLLKYANSFGFYQIYTEKVRANRKGYEMELWHWSYITKADMYLRLYNKLIKYDDLKDFKGSDFAEEFNIFSDYVNGI